MNTQPGLRTEYTTTIYGVEPSDDTMPLWESFGHNSFDAAYRAAKEHIENAHPEDRIEPRDHGEYTVWTTEGDEQWTQVATVVIKPE